MCWYLCCFFTAGLFVALDQYTKYLAVTTLKGKPSLILINGVFELTYLENTGAAFGILENARWLFIVGSFIISFLALYVLVKLPREKKYIPLLTVVILLISGAVGNMIDRLLNGFVVDFLYFSLIDFPVFNVADIYVTVGVAVFLVCFWMYSDEDLQMILRKK